jgi:hypothetical protein
MHGADMVDVVGFVDCLELGVVFLWLETVCNAVEAGLWDEANVVEELASQMGK